MSDWNPTDDELRVIARGLTASSARHIAQLVLREREAAADTVVELNLTAQRLADAEARLADSRTAGRFLENRVAEYAALANAAEFRAAQAEAERDAALSGREGALAVIRQTVDHYAPQLDAVFRPVRAGGHAQTPAEIHQPYTDDGITYCGWDKHEGCGELWPCTTVRGRAQRTITGDTP